MAIKAGKHIRTKEIREKHSIAIKKAIAKGIKLGRKKGCKGKKTGWYIKCATCDKLVYVKPCNFKTKRVCSRKCLFVDPIYRQKLKNTNRDYQKDPNWGCWLIKEDTPKYKRYRNKVTRLSNKIYAENINIINPNRYPRTRCGIKGGYQLDHIIPVSECYKNNISPEEASSLNNLRILPWKENLMKEKI